MSKITYIGGDYIENIGGSKKTYVTGNHEVNSNKQIIQIADKGIFYQKPEIPPKNNEKITDIIFFVAGTTDPININSEKHQANTKYWQDNNKNFYAKVLELHPQFHDLHIQGEFFSWSGDNDTKERNKAADRLLDMALRVYPKFKCKCASLRLNFG